MSVVPAGPTIALPRTWVDAVRLLQVVLVALTPFIPATVLVQVVYALVTAVAPLLVVRAAVSPVSTE